VIKRSRSSLAHFDCISVEKEHLMLGLALNVGNVAEVHRVALLGALATRVGKRLFQKYA